eukprot:Skav220188  [mRNA]  locus=scaffold1074:164941:169255:- [translate_table: standard]
MTELNGSAATHCARLAEDALNEALAAAEQTWTPWNKEGDVQVSTCSVPSAALPMFRGQMQRTDAKLHLADVVKVLLSDSCRRFWDPSYAESRLLYDGASTGGWAVLCTKQKASPVASESTWVHVSSCRCSQRRVTYVASSLPEEPWEQFPG